MSPVAVPRTDGIDFDIVAPTPSISLGAFSFDPIRLFTGASLADHLAPFLRAPMGRRGTFDVYPLTLADGDGITVPVKNYGALGFRNFQGLFVIVVPSILAGQIGAALAGEVARGNAAARFDPASNGQTAEWGIRVRPGLRFPITIGSVQLALETPQ